MTLRTFLCLLAIPCAVALRGAETEESLIIESGTGYLDRTGLVTYTNGAVLKYGATILSADWLSINSQTAETFAHGNVVLVREGGAVWRGEHLAYNFKSRVISTTEFRTGQPPFLASGQGLITDPTNQTYITTNAFFTTDDVLQPGYRIQARKLVIVPGKSIEAHNAVLYAGSVPVMYLPYMLRSLNRHPNNFEFRPGYRSSWGAYLLSTYNWYWDQRLHGSLNFDMRSDRGFAGGPDFFWHDPTIGDGLMRYYYAHDNDPENEPGYERIKRDRQRFYFAHQATIRPYLTAKGVAAYQSDPLIVRDFFESEYDNDVQPKSFLELNQAWPNWNLNFLAQPQLNEFQETVERLPDLRLTGLRQQVGPSPFYYESESSAGFFRHEFGEVRTNGVMFESPPFSAARFDTFHQVLLPWTFFGWLNVTPRVGERLTYYTEAHEEGATTDEELRTVFNTGAEVSMKASRVWRGAENTLLDVHGLRHIVQPSVNYVFVPTPDIRPRQLPQFDSELPSSRLLPIECPDYNSIDSIDAQNVLRLGLRNKLQTKRDGRIDNLLHWAIYTDWRLDPRRGQSTFADFYSDFDFKPRSWIMFNSETRFNEEAGRFMEANHHVTILPDADWNLEVGHRYREDTPELGIGNNLIMTSLLYRLNENWGLRLSHHYEARDGTLEKQYYTVYRDFRSWTGALTLRIRDDRDDPTDYTVAFTFSIKAFPRYAVGDDALLPQRLLGR